MEYEDFAAQQQQPVAFGWGDYTQPSPEAMADMLRAYVSPNAQEPNVINQDQTERLKSLLEQGRMQQQTPYQQQPRQQMSGMNMMGIGTQTIGDVSGIPANYNLGTGIFGNKYAASQGYEPLDHANYNSVAGTIDDAGGIESVGGSGNQNWFGGGGKLGGGWGSAFGGALSGYNQGAQNYRDDPNMWNQKDGFGTQHKDYRAEVGGGTLGGVMGYFGGPVGAALAGPTVKAVHPFAEKTTRGLINFGDKWGGATGASMMDPVGTMSSGKYKWGEIFQVPFTKNLFGW